MILVGCFKVGGYKLFSVELFEAGGNKMGNLRGEQVQDKLFSVECFKAGGSRVGNMRK